ncbi:MAG: type IV pilus assembly protein PilM [Fibrobacterota bacterium]
MEWLRKFHGHQSTVGLDIGSHSLKLAKVAKRKDGYYLEATGIKELKPGTIVNGDIKKKDELIDAVTTLINQCDPSITQIVISMSGHGILSDKFLFKRNANENVEEVILWEAGQRSPFDVEDITLDYKILRELPESNELEVLLVAAKNKIMQGYIDLLYEAGFSPVVVDADAFAIYNCYCLENDGFPDSGTVVLLNIGHELTSVIFIKDGLFHSSRDISTAGEFFTKTLMRNLNVDEKVAKDIIAGRAVDSHDPVLVRRSMEFAAEELSAGIDLAFSYYRNSEKNDQIKKIVLSGGGAYIPELPSFLKKRHETEVQVSNPLAHLQYDMEMFGAVNPQSISAFLTVSVGLASRKLEI